MDPNAYSFALAHSDLLPRVQAQLVRELGSAKEVWEAPAASFAETPGLTPGARGKFLTFRTTFPIAEKWEAFQRSEIGGIGIESAEYPEALKATFDPPVFLFYRGDPSVLKKPLIAIVGSRKATPYGKLEAAKLAETLAGCGFVVTSGLAMGIDAAAHRGALDGGGETVAVLGSGVDQIFPRENELLAARILKQGALVSEFPPGTLPRPWHFPQRNRIISGLSLGVIVAEAGEKSGALITARYAGEQGREVFALPGRAGSPLSRGGNRLIQDGGKLVQEIGDILAEFPYLSLDLPPRTPEKTGKHPGSSLEGRLLGTIKKEKKGCDIEDLIRETGSPAPEVAGTLAMLETKGLVTRLPGNHYVGLL